MLINTWQEVEYSLDICRATTGAHKSGDLGGQAVGPLLLINTWQELKYRLDICRVTTGAHIEV